MKSKEANKIIAAYMGNENPVPINIEELSPLQKKNYQPYAYSLDAIVPVWEKLCSTTHGEHSRLVVPLFMTERGTHIQALMYMHKNLSIQEAACIATAKAIKELGK